MDFRLELDFSILLCLFFQTCLPFRGSTPLVNIMIRFKACNLAKMESRVSGPLLSQLGLQSHVDCSRTASVFISAVPSWAMSNTPHILSQGAGSLRFLCLFFFFLISESMRDVSNVSYIFYPLICPFFALEVNSNWL